MRDLQYDDDMSNAYYGAPFIARRYHAQKRRAGRDSAAIIEAKRHVSSWWPDRNEIARLCARGLAQRRRLKVLLPDGADGAARHGER